MKNEVLFQEIVTRKRIQILHFCINISVSLIKSWENTGKNWLLFLKSISSHLEYSKFQRTLELLENITSLDLWLTN